MADGNAGVDASRRGIRAQKRRWIVMSVILLGVLFPLPSTVLARKARKIKRHALKQIRLLEDEKTSRTPAQLKMDSQLVYALDRVRGGPLGRKLRALRPSVSVTDDGRVLVDATAQVSDALLDFIRNLGGEVLNSVPEYDAVRAVIPLASVEALAERDDVRFVEPAVGVTTNTGSVVTEGDDTHRAGDARTVFGVTGAGVNIGVLSDSVDFLAASQALNDLGAVTVLMGQSGVNTCAPMNMSPCTGEGTAMLEILADLAPAAPLFFATGNGGPAQMATNIGALQAAGCNIIVDDQTYNNESPFQDGPIAQAVNAVSAAGVLYFSSARNSGNLNDGTSSTWEGDFVDGGAVGMPIPGSGRLHRFGNATFNTVTTVPMAANLRRADLFWADPLNGATNDYDLFVLDPTGTNVVAPSTNAQTGTQNPYESVTGLAVGQRIVIVRRSGAGRFLHLDIGRGRLNVATDGCVRGHNAVGAANAFSVAATDAMNSAPNPFTGGTTNPVEQFSSDGPRRIFFNPNGTAITPGNFSATGGTVLQKPDITAADDTTSSTALSVGCPNAATCFNPFGGTSAAAPHAAAIAALLLSSTPAPTAAQVRTALTSTALDIEAPGVDRDSGAGIVMAFAALKSLNPCTVTCPASVTRANDSGQCGATVSYPGPTTSGGCAGAATCAPPAGSFFPVGSTTVTCTTPSEDNCSFTVTVQDTEPPTISCPADIVQPNDPGLCSAVVTFAPTASDNCPGVTTACFPPSASIFPKGTTSVACSATDHVGLTAACNFGVTVNDVEPPRVTCSLARRSLWPPNHDLASVGFESQANDNCPGSLTRVTLVSSDEDDEARSGDGRFSPDAELGGRRGLRLRAERRGDESGRVYLTSPRATDTSGNTGFACCTVVVPHDRSRAATASVNVDAAAAEGFCTANGGASPPGYFVVGDGPAIGPKR